jgi:putative ABC transport system permease protein
MGAMTGHWMSDLYAQFYSFPTRPFHVSPGLVAGTTAIGLVAGVGGALGAVRRIAHMPPAEAMRPPTPLSYRRSLLERLGLGSVIGPSAMMVVREIRRRPLRFALSSAGIAMGIGIFIIGRFSTSSFDRLMTEVFPREQQQDTTVMFARALPVRALHELEHVPGVLLAEGQRIVPVRVHAGTRWRDTAITGIPRTSTLRVLLDAGVTPVALPDSGVVMCDRLAAALGIQVGDAVDVELLEGDFSHRRVTVVRLIDEAFGLPIYARADWLSGLMREQPRVSVALLRLDPAQADAVSARLKQLPQVISVTSLARIVDNYNKQIGGSMLIMTLILTLSAAAIATGVVYNNARIALSMRSRDLASLRVLGFTRREISSVLLGELGAQVALGIGLGMFVGRWWALALASTFPAESFHFPTYISPRTYVAAAVIALVSGLASALLVRRKLDSLDLVAVLKSSE